MPKGGVTVNFWVPSGFLLGAITHRIYMSKLFWQPGPRQGHLFRTAVIFPDAGGVLMWTAERTQEMKPYKGISSMLKQRKRGAKMKPFKRPFTAKVKAAGKTTRLAQPKFKLFGRANA